MDNLGEDEDPKDLCTFDKREENAEKLINFIEKDINNGRVLYNRLFNYSNKIVRNYHDAEDVVSHFILNLIKRGALTYEYNINGSVDGKLTRWLYRGVRNLSISLLRDRNRLNVSSLSSRDDEDFIFINEYCCKQEEAPDKRASRKEALRVVFENIPNLKPEYRNVLTQRYFDYASYKEISETQHIPMGTVKSRLYYAKKKFSELEDVVALAVN